MKSISSVHQFTIYIKSRLVGGGGGGGGGEGKYQNMKWFNVGVKTRLMEGRGGKIK